MTSPLRRKRRTTARARNFQGPTLASLLVLLGSLASAPAQQPLATSVPMPAPTRPPLRFRPPSDVTNVEGMPAGTPRWLDPNVVRTQARGAAPLGGAGR